MTHTTSLSPCPWTKISIRGESRFGTEETLEMISVSTTGDFPDKVFYTKCTEEFVIDQILKWSGVDPLLYRCFTHKIFQDFQNILYIDQLIEKKWRMFCPLLGYTQFLSLAESCHIYYCTPKYVLSIPAKVCIIYAKVCIIYFRFSIHQVNNVTTGNVVHLMYWELKIDLWVPSRWRRPKRVWWGA